MWSAMIPFPLGRGEVEMFNNSERELFVEWVNKMIEMAANRKDTLLLEEIRKAGEAAGWQLQDIAKGGLG